MHQTVNLAPLGFGGFKSLSSHNMDSSSSGSGPLAYNQMIREFDSLTIHTSPLMATRKGEGWHLNAVGWLAGSRKMDRRGNAPED